MVTGLEALHGEKPENQVLRVEAWAKLLHLRNGMGPRSQEQDGMNSFWGLTASIAGFASGVIINVQNTKKRKNYQKSMYTHISIE